MAQLDVTLTPESEHTWILHLNGTVDVSTHQKMWSVKSSTLLVEQMVEAGANLLVIELTHVERIDSHGLSVILSSYKAFSEQGIGIVLRNPNPHLHRLFRLMQFDQVFTIESQE